MKKHSLASVGMIAVLALSACGGNGETDGGGETDDDAVIAGGDFNIGWDAQPPTLDPLLTTATATRDIARNYFEPLLTVDSDGAVQPVLAEEFEMSDDALTLTFTLREAVPFHDGSTMEAADVVASLDRWIERSNVGSMFFGEALVESPEEGVVTMGFEQPMASAPLLLADQSQMPMIMPATIIENETDEGLEELIGTGPYELGEWVTDQHVRVDRFDDYVSPEGETSGTAGRKEAHFDSMYFHFVADSSTRVSGLQSGEFDAAVGIPWDNGEMLENDPDLALTVGDFGFGFAAFNHAEGVMSDVNMRQAALAAINPEENQQAAFSVEEYYNTSGALMPEGSEWHVEADYPRFADQDQDEIDELLEAAGYNGEPIRILVTRDYDQHYNIAVVFQQQLENAGMNAELVVTDWATVLGSRENLGDWEIYMSADSWPAIPAAWVFFSGESWGAFASTDENVRAALEDVVYATDDESAMAASEALQDAFYEDLPVIKFGDYSILSAMRSDYEGFSHTPYSGNTFYNVRPVE